MVYERARRLQREEGYDLTQWEPDGVQWQWSSEYPVPPHAILLVEEGAIAVGVVAFNHKQHRRFSLDQPASLPPGWHMLFVWVAPEWRRRGVLTRRWSALRETYGEFTLERPLSDAMKAFAAKMGHPSGLTAR